MLKEFHMWAFLGENLSPVWVKNEKKKFVFRLVTSLPKQFSLEAKFLAAIVS